MEVLLLDLALIIIVATVGALIARWLKQPIIPAYIIAGILLGPIFGLITDTDLITVYAEIGIAFLLFIVGLELDLDRIKSIGWVASAGGLLQVGITFVIGFVGTLVLGFGPLQASYLGLVVAFSSTFVVIKLLSDSHEIDSLHGRIIIGMLLIQDILAVLALSVFSSLDALSPSIFVMAVLKGLSLFILAWLLAHHIVPQVFHFAAKSNELLFLSSLAVMFSFSIAAELLGYSIAIGAFIAGITLGNLPYQVEIIGRVKPLRDFFATLFFVSLGLKFIITDFNGFLGPLTVVVFMVIILKPLILMMIGSAFGYTLRTSFLTGLTMGQVSEFSLILLLQGMNLGHISQKLFSFVVLVTMFTIATSSYFIKYDDFIYKTIGKRFRFMERFGAQKREMANLPKKNYDVLLVGCDRAGSVVLNELQDQKNETLVVDFNPELLRKLIRKKVSCIYGDIMDPEVIEHIPFKSLWLTVSSIPDYHVNKNLIRLVKHHTKKCLVFVTANSPKEALDLYKHGADYVILPHLLGGEHVALMLKHKMQKITNKKVKGLSTMKQRHIADLKERLEI